MYFFTYFLYGKNSEKNLNDFLRTFENETHAVNMTK